MTDSISTPGIYTNTGEEINGRPLYTKGSTSWFAVGSDGGWVGGTFDYYTPGSNFGRVMENLQWPWPCPNQVPKGEWMVSITDKNPSGEIPTSTLMFDDSFTVTCGARKEFKENESLQGRALMLF